ncbi:sugar phosphate nucleotidyltransferase [Natrinema marinum]|uniref:sugar phosphate nucleotidyltransferase n=1 Tax=Natrinema marinum TaxID=2961598 RepID=UPI0020C8665B|nr:sugar phosphate nucleotidyltransferase [Natrinema marinum]
MSVRSAIVLAAGEGKRLRPLTEHRPKPMLPAATKPILEHVFDALIAAGVTDITVVVGYGRNRVQSHFGSTYRDVPLTYVIQEKQLGSGHALLAAEAEIEGPSLVVNGDQLVDRRIVEDVVAAHDADAAATLGLIRHRDVADYGGVILKRDGADGSSRRVTEIVENPRDDRSYQLNAGVYALEARAFDAVRAASSRPGEHTLVDGLAALIDGDVGTVQGVVSDGIWIDATYPWDLLAVADALLEDTADGIVERHVGSSARIHEDATVREPVVVAEDCVVGPGAVIGPNVCLGENVTVDSNAVVEHSVVDADTRIGPNATLVDCVTGRGVRVGPGSTVVGGPGDVHVRDRIHRDEDLGALLADRVRDEGGVTYAPGTVVGSSAVLGTGVTVCGSIDAETEVRN